jgi:hypothetical protein
MPTFTSPLPPALNTFLHPCSLALFILSNFWGKQTNKQTKHHFNYLIQNHEIHLAIKWKSVTSLFKKVCIWGEERCTTENGVSLTLSFSCLFTCSAFIKLICNNLKTYFLECEILIIYNLVKEQK